MLVLIYGKPMFMCYIGKHRTQLNLNIGTGVVTQLSQTIRDTAGKGETRDKACSKADKRSAMFVNNLR